MYTDSPVLDSRGDKLGRILFAKEIAKGLVESFKSNTESIVLGINGPWGSGKSTLVNFIIEEVEARSIAIKKDAIFIRFNPWMFSGQKELQNIFFKEMLLKLESKKGKLKKVAKKLSQLIDYFNWLKYLHTGAGELVKDSKQILDSYTSKKDLTDLKSALDNILIESEVKLYITIDDIDRLTPTEITDIFQLVKLNGNFANTIFIVAYDNEVVKAALTQKFGTNGEKYIEKIIQIDYSIPPLSRNQIKNIFNENIDHISNDSIIKISILEYFGGDRSERLTELFSSLRDVYRYINAIKIRLSSIAEELNIRDFFLIEALRLFRPKVYEFVINSKEILTQGSDHEKIIKINPLRKKNTDTGTQLIEKQPFDDNSKGILHSLFVFESVFNQASPEILLVNRHVADKTYFDRYFNLQLNDSDIPEKLFSNFLSGDTATKINILQAILKRDRLYHFTSLISVRIENGAVSSKQIIEASLSISSTLQYYHQRPGISGDIITMFRFCSKLLEYITSVDERRLLITNHLRLSSAKAYAEIILCKQILTAKHFFDDDNLRAGYMWYHLFFESNQNENRFANEILEIQKNKIKTLFDFVKENPDAVNDDELCAILDDLYKYHQQIYEAEFMIFLNTAKILLRTLLICITSSYASDGTNIGYEFSRKQLFPLMNMDDLTERLNEIKFEELDAIQRATINFFKKAAKENFEEKKYHKFEIPEETIGH